MSDERKRLVLQHYHEMALESEHIRRERELQAEIDRLRGELDAANQTIAELRADR